MKSDAPDEMVTGSESVDAHIGHSENLTDLPTVKPDGGSGTIVPASQANWGRTDDPRVLVLARLNRSFLYQQHGAPADGAKELEAVVELEPGRAPVYGDLVALYLELGRTDEAADALSRGEAHGFESASHA